MKRERQEAEGVGGGGFYPPLQHCKGKSSLTDGSVGAEEHEAADELLAELGYKVRASSMADVAQKLEQLEMAMTIGGAAVAAAPVGLKSVVVDDNAVVSHLATETVHYNPSDLSSWLEGMLSELNMPTHPPAPAAALEKQVTDQVPIGDPRGVLYIGSGVRNDGKQSDDDLRAGVGGAHALLIEHPIGPGESSTVEFPSPRWKHGTELDDLSAIVPRAALGEGGREKKRMKLRASGAAKVGDNSNSGGGGGVEATVESQEAGIRLVHALLACAESVEQEKLGAAEALVKQIGVLAMSQGGAMRKVARYFAEGLARRIYGVYPAQELGPGSDILQLHFYEACPYLKFAHFTANQAILEAFAGKRRVHVIDLSMKQGMQWPALMQALALRAEGPPSLRVTGIGQDAVVQEVGWKLAEVAESMHVQFEYRGLVASSLAEVEPYMVEWRRREEEEEVIAVNSVLELHRLLGQAGAVEKVLGTIKGLRPRIVTVVEQEANHNSGVFTERFTEALHYYSSMFDSLEGCGNGQKSSDEGEEDEVMTEVYLGRQICNVVGCEGGERTERHETAAQWRSRMTGAGFEAVPLGSNAFKQASMLVEVFGGREGYRVEEKDGCLMLGWHTRPLMTTSAWRLGSSS